MIINGGQLAILLKQSDIDQRNIKDLIKHNNNKPAVYTTMQSLSKQSIKEEDKTIKEEEVFNENNNRI